MRAESGPKQYIAIIMNLVNWLYYSLILFFSFLLMLGCAKVDNQEPPNILLICIDDLRPELKSFGADHIYSPNIDKLASNGVSFMRHYVNAPSCGPSRYTLLTGQYGHAGNNALFQRAASIQKGELSNDPSMPEWFRMNGYKRFLLVRYLIIREEWEVSFGMTALSLKFLRPGIAKSCPLGIGNILGE